MTSSHHQKRSADIIWKIFLPISETFVYIIQELQSRPDFTMPYRTLVYTMNTILNIFESTEKKKRKKKNFQLPVVIAVVLYNGAEAWNASAQFSDYQKGFEQFDNYAINFQYYFVNLNTLNEEFIRNSNTLVDNILAVDKIHSQSEWILALGDIASQVKKLPHSDQMDFWIWVKEVLNVTIVNKEEIDAIITVLQEKEGDSMVSGLERILKKEFKEARKTGKAQADRESLLLFNHLENSGQQDLFPKALENPAFKNELIKKLNIV